MNTATMNTAMKVTATVATIISVSHMSHCRVIFVVSDKLRGSQGICYTECEGLFVLHKSGSGFRIRSANLFWTDPDLDLGSSKSFPSEFPLMKGIGHE